MLLITQSVMASQELTLNNTSISNATSSMDFYHNNHQNQAVNKNLHFDFSTMDMSEIKKYFAVTSGGTMSKTSDGGLNVRTTSYRGKAYIYSLFNIPAKYAYDGLTIRVRFQLGSGWTKTIDRFPEIVYPKNLITSQTLPSPSGVTFPLFSVYGGYGDGYRTFRIYGYNGNSWTTVTSTGWHPSDGGRYCAEIKYYPDKVVASYYDFGCTRLLASLTYHVPSNLKGKYLEYYYQNGELHKFPDDKFVFIMGTYDDYTRHGLTIYDITIDMKSGSNLFDYKPKKIFAFPKPVFDLWSNLNKFQMSYIYYPKTSISGSYSGLNIPVKTASFNNYIVKGVYMPYFATLSASPSLGNSTYLIVVKGVLFGEYRCLYKSASENTGGNHVGVFVNGKMIFWEPVYCENSKFLNDDSLPVGDYIVKMGDNKYVKKHGQPFRVMLFYDGPISSLKIQVSYASLREDLGDNFALIRSVDIYRVSAQKVYDSGNDLSKALNNGDFTLINENGQKQNKTVYVSETNETVLGGGSGFGHGAKIILNKQFQTINGVYAVKFRYYFFDSWDAELGRNVLGDSAVLYDDGKYVWGVQFDWNSYFDNYYGEGYTEEPGKIFPLVELIEWGFATKLSNYFNSRFPDHYANISIVLPENNITKLTWSNTLDQDGNDESMGLGRVQIYKITNVKTIDISSDIYIPLPTETTSNPHPVHYEFNEKTLLTNEYGKVVLYYKNDSIISSFDINPVLENYNITITDFDFDLNHDIGHYSVFVNYIKFRLPESYSIKISSSSKFASDIISSQYDGGNYKFSIKNSDIKPVAISIYNADNKVVGALLFIPKNHSIQLPITFYTYDTIVPSNVAHTVFDSLPEDKKDYMNITITPHYEDCTVIMNYTVKQVSDETLDVMKENNIDLSVIYGVSTFDGAKFLEEHYNKSTGVLTAILQFGKHGRFNTRMTIKLMKDGLVLYSSIPYTIINLDWVVSNYQILGNTFKITNYKVDNITEYDFRAPDGSIKYFYSMDFTFDYDKIFDKYIEVDVNLNGQNAGIHLIKMETGDSVNSITRQLVLKQRKIQQRIPVGLWCGKGHYKVRIYFTTDRKLTSDDKITISFENEHQSVIKSLQVDVNNITVKNIDMFNQDHIIVQGNDVVIQYPGLQNYEVLPEGNTHITQGQACSEIDESTSITFNTEGDGNNNMDEYSSIAEGSVLTSIVGGTVPSSINTCVLFRTLQNVNIIAINPDEPSQPHTFTSVIDLFNYMVKNNLDHIKLYIVTPYLENTILSSMLKVGGAVANGQSNSDTTGYGISSEYFSLRYPEITFTVTNMQKFKDAVSRLNKLNGFIRKPMEIILERQDSGNSMIKINITESSNIKYLIDSATGEKIPVTPGTIATLTSNSGYNSLKAYYIIPINMSKDVSIHFKLIGDGEVKVELNGPVLTPDNILPVYSSDYTTDTTLTSYYPPTYSTDEYSTVEVKPLKVDNVSYKITSVKHIDDEYSVSINMYYNVTVYSEIKIYLAYKTEPEDYYSDSSSTYDLKPGKYEITIPIVLTIDEDDWNSDDISNINVMLKDYDYGKLYNSITIPITNLQVSKEISFQYMGVVTYNYNENKPNSVKLTVNSQKLFNGYNVVYLDDVLDEITSAVHYNTTITIDDEEDLALSRLFAKTTVGDSGESGNSDDNTFYMLPNYFIINGSKNIIISGTLNIVNFLIQEANSNDDVIAVFTDPDTGDILQTARIVNIDVQKLVNAKSLMADSNTLILLEKPKMIVMVRRNPLGGWGQEHDLDKYSRLYNITVSNITNLANINKFGKVALKYKIANAGLAIKTSVYTPMNYFMYIIPDISQPSSLTLTVNAFPLLFTINDVFLKYRAQIISSPYESLTSDFSQTIGIGIYTFSGDRSPSKLPYLITGLQEGSKFDPYPNPLMGIFETNNRYFSEYIISFDLTKEYNITLSDLISNPLNIDYDDYSTIVFGTNNHIYALLDKEDGDTITLGNGTSITVNQTTFDSLPSYYTDYTVNTTSKEMNVTIKEIPHDTYLLVFIPSPDDHPTNDEINSLISNTEIIINGERIQSANYILLTEEDYYGGWEAYSSVTGSTADYSSVSGSMDSNYIVDSIVLYIPLQQSNTPVKISVKLNTNAPSLSIDVTQIPGFNSLGDDEKEILFKVIEKDYNDVFFTGKTLFLGFCPCFMGNSKSKGSN